MTQNDSKHKNVNTKFKNTSKKHQSRKYLSVRNATMAIAMKKSCSWGHGVKHIERFNA